MRLELNQIVTDTFPVYGNNDEPLTGLTSFTGLLITPSGTFSTGLTITEIGSGIYGTTFTPNLTGIWSVEIRESEHFPWGKRETYFCDDSYALAKRTLGLTHENFLLTGLAYDVNGKMTAGKKYLYTDSGFTEVLAEYTITPAYAGSTNPSRYEVKRV